MANFTDPQLETNAQSPGQMYYTVIPLKNSEFSFRTSNSEDVPAEDLGGDLLGNEILIDAKTPGILYGKNIRIRNNRNHDIMRLYLIDPSGKRVLLLH